MRRREFITILGGAALAGPFAATAQQPTVPVIGYLANAKPEGFAAFLQAFRQGLAETGYVEGRNVATEYRWAEGDADRLPRLAADLVGRKVAVIVATGGNAPAQAAKAATATTPIVFTGGGDPVKLGLVESLGHPGGNVTGALNFSGALTAKRLALLRDLVPGATLIAVLVNSASPDTEKQVAEIQEAARSIGQAVRVVSAGSEQDLEAALATVVQVHAGALFVTADPLFTNPRSQLLALVARRGVPASYSFADLARAGGLMSYGSIWRTCTGRLACTRAASSRAPSQPICRCCSPPSSRWSSTSRPLKPLASRSRSRCCYARTRSFSSRETAPHPLRVGRDRPVPAAFQHAVEGPELGGSSPPT